MYFPTLNLKINCTSTYLCVFWSKKTPNLSWALILYLLCISYQYYDATLDVGADEENKDDPVPWFPLATEFVLAVEPEVQY
jgi:hypothetical protein